MRKIVHNKISYLLINMLIWFAIFSVVPTLFQLLLYFTLPFDYFVKINSYVANHSSSQIITIKLNRIARFDVEATSIKEVYRVDEDGIKQVYEVPKRMFVYETDANGQTVTFEQPVPDLPVGNYYISDTITLELPKGIEKTKTIKSNSFLVENNS